jgi:hypothetical protein
MSSDNGDKNAERVEFIYTGQPESQFPTNITHLIVESSVSEIPERAFTRHHKLVDVKLQEGLEVIGDRSFFSCIKLKKVNFPSTLRDIGRDAFCMTALTSIVVPDSLRRVGFGAFLGCASLISVKLSDGIELIEAVTFFKCDSITSQRIPPSVTKFGDNGSGAFGECLSLLSIEIPKEIKCLGALSYGTTGTFFLCESLVNIALPLSIEDVRSRTFDGCTKLREIFPDHNDLVNALKHRFDELTLHELCYYQSYHSSSDLMEKLRQIMTLDPRAAHEIDDFGMTPFHILALSAAPNIDFFQKLLHVCPRNLLDRKDKWGRTTWNYLYLNDTPFSNALLELAVSTRVQHLGLRRWRSAVQDDILLLHNDHSDKAPERMRRRNMLVLSLAKHEQLESTSLLELVLWKIKIDSSYNAQNNNNRRKRLKLDVPKTSVAALDRENCRMNCGSNIVIPNILAFLGMDYTVIGQT